MGAFDYSEIAARIVEAKPRALRRLRIADFDEESCDLSDSTLDNIAPILGALPHLENLELRVGSVALQPLEHTELKRLSITIDNLTDANVAALASSALPSLETLRINGCGKAMKPQALDALFNAPPAGLQTFALTFAVDTEPVIRSLLTSPLGAQLRTLDISFGTVSDTALFGDAAVAHLAKLNVVGNYIPDDFETVLGERVTELAFRDQRENLDGYAPVTEKQVRDYAPDAKSVAAARKVAKPASWPRLGREPNLLWGVCSGSSNYEVVARLGASITDAACTCPSRKYPCKHALALLLLAAGGHRFPRENAPRALVSNAESARYENSWE